LLEKIVITSITIFLFYELLEHVVLPLLGFSFGKKRPSKSGREGLIGQEAEVVEWKGTSGMVRLNGEYWQASGSEFHFVGKIVRIDNIQGLKLSVRSYENSNSK
jgi:membrane protein implicated in regulation of membrane protease activity